MEFSNEMLQRLTEANNSVKGSRYYSKYYMQCYNGKTFCGYSIPYTEGQIKLSRGKDAKLCIYSCGNRYIMTDTVKELLGI